MKKLSKAACRKMDMDMAYCRADDGPCEYNAGIFAERVALLAECRAIDPSLSLDMLCAFAKKEGNLKLRDVRDAARLCASFKS